MTQSCNARNVISPHPISITASFGVFPAKAFAARKANASIGPEHGTPKRLQPVRPESWIVASPLTSMTSSDIIFQQQISLHHLAKIKTEIQTRDQIILDES